MTTDQTDAIRLIQSGLDKLGHSPGAIDGHWGVRTARALKQLLAANGRAAVRWPRPARCRGSPRRKPRWAATKPATASWLMDWLKRDGRSLGDPVQEPLVRRLRGNLHPHGPAR